MPRAARSARSGRVATLAGEALSGASPRGRLCGAFVLGTALALIGPDRLARGPQLCLISAIIRRPCPGCGMTRAASALLRGELGRALRTNWRIIPVALISGTILLDDLQSVMQQRTR